MVILFDVILLNLNEVLSIRAQEYGNWCGWLVFHDFTSMKS